MGKNALEYLNRDYLLNVDIIESLRRGDSEVLRAENDGVLVREKEGYLYFLSCDSVEAAKRLTDGYDIHLCVLHGCEHIDEIARMLGLNHGRECYQAAYIKKSPVDVGAGDIRILDTGYAQFVAQTYAHRSVEEAAEELENGVYSGIFIDGELAGFMGRHGEGSMGMLEIVQKYRRRGLAYTLEGAFINRLIEQGDIPYGQIYTDNSASVELQKKLGLEFSDRNICWLWKRGD